MNCPVSRHQNAFPRAQYLTKEQAGELLQNLLRVMIRLLLYVYSRKVCIATNGFPTRNVTDSPLS